MQARIANQIFFHDIRRYHQVPDVFSDDHQRRWQDGRTLTRTPLGETIEKEFGAPHYIFHRGELHAMLARAVPSALTLATKASVLPW